MDDAAPRGHQVARAGADRRIGAEAVAMVDRALEQIGDGRQVDMRVRAHVHPLPDVEMRGAELVDEDEGANHRPRLVGQRAADVERADIVGRGGDDGRGHQPSLSSVFFVFSVSTLPVFSVEVGSSNSTWHSPSSASGQCSVPCGTMMNSPGSTIT